MEKEVIALLIAKNFLGLEKFIDLFGTDIIKCIRSILNHPKEKMYHKEVENEVFYRIWQKIASYDAEKSSLKTWSLTITRNLCLDKKRQIIREQQIIPMEQLPESFWEEDYFEKENFLDLLTYLTDDDQLIFLKYYYYQDSAAEIAKELNMEVTQIYNRLSRGREKLRHSIKPT
ncbi:sigma-70 family RNA polymerase sigma factor [Enterococcus termitis]|uniref:RNA polymerase subunit sigma-70 n=1 Tax=Enterococcus termitis TaxID=332950 RepID=A0A1E5GZ16_9ENTE|nr:sigma-70 family RNA polymerase sigma factor [Enterococcus termitis]OEG17984.1 RNA polymerase subunit sigma-70 [Enterococcus termitis]OJG97111.1 sigma-70 family RNA polymerase sigma factor [Enterococcus termitis]